MVGGGGGLWFADLLEPRGARRVVLAGEFAPVSARGSRVARALFGLVVRTL